MSCRSLLTSKTFDKLSVNNLFNYEDTTTNHLESRLEEIEEMISKIDKFKEDNELDLDLINKLNEFDNKYNTLVKNHDTQLKNHYTQLENHDAKLKQNETTINELDAKINQNEITIKELDTKLKQNETTIDDLRLKFVTDIDNTIDKLMASYHQTVLGTIS